MSGTAFLEEIVTWDDEKRAEKVEEALPRLIICFEEHTSNDEAIGILQIVCQSFVPVVQQDQLEEKVFSKISQQVCQIVDAVLEETHEAVSQQDTHCDHIISLLQHVVTVSQCVEDCVKHMAALSDLHTSHVRSLLSCSFHILKGSYSHCQESSSVYGDLLPSLSDSLSLIFRTAHSLHMVVLNLLERLVIPQPAGQDCVQDVAQVCADLYAVCRVVACLDLKLTISLWKALTKLAGPQAGVLYGHLDVSGMLRYLCEQLTTGVTQLLLTAPSPTLQDQQTLSQGDEKVFQKSVRILSFQMKVLVAVVRDFSAYLTDCVPSIHSLLIYLTSILRPSLSAAPLQERHEQEVRHHVCNATQPLTSHLLTNASFIRCLLSQSEIKDKQELARLLVMVMVMDGVAQSSGEVMTQWLDSSSSENQSCPSLLFGVLSALDSCHVEVCLPVYLAAHACEGKPNRTVSVYQYTVEHVCSFIASCPAKLFHCVERDLWRGVLGSNPICCQAAMDCWCFLARYGTSELCWQHTQQLMSLLIHVCQKSPLPPPCHPLSSLLRRLVKFLTPQHQVDLIALVPGSVQVAVWGEVGVEVLSQAVMSELCHTLVPVCLTAVSQFVRTGCPTLYDAATVTPAMQCLHKILHTDASRERVGVQQCAALIDMVSALWATAVPQHPQVLTVDASNLPLRQTFLAAVFVLTSDIVDQLEVKLLLQILVLAHKLLSLTPSRELTLAILQLMQSLGHLKLPPSVEQGQILRKTAEIFASCLTHRKACVQYRALESFTRFAEHTLYESVVPDCLALCPGLHQKVAAYLQKTPLPTDKEFDTVWYLQKQRHQFAARCHADPLPAKMEEATMSPRHGKRPRLEEETEEASSEASYQGMLSKLEAVTQKMEKLGEKGPLPSWLVTSSEPLVQRLASCLRMTPGSTQ